LYTLILSENLTSDPEFAGTGNGGLLDWAKEVVKLVVYGPQVDLKRRMNAYDRTVKKLRKRMKVERERNTYVISITMKLGDSAKAAKLANRLAEIYIADVNNAAANSTREAAGVLSAKLEEMRAAVNKSAAAVEIYRQDNNLIDTNKSLLVEQQLTDLNRELSQARLEVQNTQARRNQLTAAVSDNADPELRLPEIAESPVVSRLQTFLARAESTLATGIGLRRKTPCTHSVSRSHKGVGSVAEPGTTAHFGPVGPRLQHRTGKIESA